MSRFDSARRGRILAWAGAAVAWATALTIAVLEPQDAQARAPIATTPSSAAGVVSASALASMPAPPAQGVMILRYQPSVNATPEVRTVYIQQAPPSATGGVAAQPAPTPKSSGS